MQFITLQIFGPNYITPFATYHSLYIYSITQALAVSEARHTQACLHYKHIHEAEQALSRLYSIPFSVLKGANMIFGSITELRRGLTNRNLREKIKNNLIWFRVNIMTEIREVRVYATESPNPNSTFTLFKTYTISHDFFGTSILGDPIVAAA